VFYTPQNKHVFTAMLSLAERSSAIDTMTVFAELDRLGRGKDVARSEVEALSAWVPAAGNIAEYADRAIELAQWRGWQQAASEAWAATERRDRQGFAKAQALFASRSVGTRHDTYSAERWASIMFNHFASSKEAVLAGAMPGPFEALNDALGGGLRPGEWLALSGPTTHGKSIIADQWLDTSAAAGKRCHLYMTEMTAEARGMRYLARRTGVPFMWQRRNDLTKEQRKLILDELRHMDYGCTVAADWEVDDIVRDALRARYDLVVVDLLHGFHYEDERALDRLSKAMQRLVRSSTTIDGHAGTAVIAVTHLKEEGTKNGKVPRPSISSIKGGSSIKQDAEFVLFCWQEQDQGGAPIGDGEVWLAKGRTGELARVKVRLNPARFCFESRGDDSVSDDPGPVEVDRQEVPF
jgi:replicative DNA helicase